MYRLQDSMEITYTYQHPTHIPEQFFYTLMPRLSSNLPNTPSLTEHVKIFRDPIPLVTFSIWPKTSPITLQLLHLSLFYFILVAPLPSHLFLKLDSLKPLLKTLSWTILVDDEGLFGHHRVVAVWGKAASCEYSWPCFWDIKMYQNNNKNPSCFKQNHKNCSCFGEREDSSTCYGHLLRKVLKSRHQMYLYHYFTERLDKVTAAKGILSVCIVFNFFLGMF